MDTQTDPRDVEEDAIITALTKAEIEGWYVMWGPGTIHVDFENETERGSVFISDTFGSPPDGTDGYCIGIHPAEGDQERIINENPIHNRDEALELFITTIREQRGDTSSTTTYPRGQ